MFTLYPKIRVKDSDENNKEQNKVTWFNKLNKLEKKENLHPTLG